LARVSTKCTSMDIIELHRNAVDRYRSYSRSFIDIYDKDILDRVIEELDTGKLWPEPLIQFNPAYLAGDSIKTLVGEGVLHPELEHVFPGFSSTGIRSRRCGSEPRRRVLSSLQGRVRARASPTSEQP